MARPPAAVADDLKTASREARKARRRDRSREEILAAARNVLFESGVGAMTLEAVAAEAGMSKTGLYYYFPSKDALVFELVYAIVERHARAVHDAVEATEDGAAALRAVIAATVEHFAPRLDDFRLAFLFGQVEGAGALTWSEAQFARLRPLNDLVFAGAEKRLRLGRKETGRPGKERAGGSGRAKGGAATGRPTPVDPRRAAFLAYLAALGLLTMKGMVEGVDDPLIHSDDELIDDLAAIFAAGAG